MSLGVSLHRIAKWSMDNMFLSGSQTRISSLVALNGQRPNTRKQRGKLSGRPADFRMHGAGSLLAQASAGNSGIRGAQA